MAMRLVFSAALAAIALLAAPVQAQPNRSASPAATLTVADGVATVAATVGGADRNAVPGNGCSGYIDNGTPTVAVALAEAGPLAIYAASDTDTTLLVLDPSGRWHCSDDARGSDPAVTFSQAASGTYKVWVGVFSPDAAGVSAQVSAVRGEPRW